MAVVQVPSDSPLYQALYPQIQTKVVDYGWTNSDDSSLTDFILLTLASGKTQEQLSEEVKDLLEEAEYESLLSFSGWLVGEIQNANGQEGASTAPESQAPQTSDPVAEQITQQEDAPPNVALSNQDQGGMDDDMQDVPTGPANGSIPSGPKSMRAGGSGRGGRGSRSNGPEVTLHRIKGTANAGRINTHAGRDSPRGAPRGPRGGFKNNFAGGRGGGMNGVNIGAIQQAAQQPSAVPNFTPEQQTYVNSMMGEGMQMLAALFAQQQQQSQMGGFGAGPGAGRGRGGQRGRGGRMFDARNGNAGQRAPHAQNGNEMEMDTASMEVDTNNQGVRQDAWNKMCRNNLMCINVDCSFAHQSPAAPRGTTVDMNDECPAKGDCKNRKCSAKHPSPASGQQVEPSICKYFPNCSNGDWCQFKHPDRPPCRNGADCETPGCSFFHNPTPCIHNPCKIPTCPYKHQPGQKLAANKADAFSKSKWVNPNLRTGGGDGDHLSQRKFVDENAGEETILPGSVEPEVKAESAEVA